MDGADRRAVATPAGRIGQVEQHIPALPALGRDQRVRRHAGDAGRDGQARYQRQHDRQHGGPGASLRHRPEKGDQATQGLGRSRGGFTTKFHERCDDHGRPLGLAPPSGQAHDVQGFGPLFRMLGDRIEALFADKGYDTDAIRAEITAAGVEAVIPAKSNRRIPIPNDRVKYRWRNLVERLFIKLKNWRRGARRSDKSR